MTNTFKKSFLILAACMVASSIGAADVIFTMSDIFDGQNLSFNITSPVSAKVSTTTTKGNAPSGKLGSTNNYFEIILNNDTYTAAKINGFINTTNTSGYNWGFQFSTDKGQTWSQTVSQPNDGNKTVHEIIVNATIPANANGFRVIRLAGTSTTVASIVLDLAGGSIPATPTVSSVSVAPASVTLNPNDTEQLTATVNVTPSTADQSVTWTSSNTNVATVTASGVVTAIAQGTATITATSKLDNTKSGTCAVTVNAPATPIPVTAIALNKGATTIAVGGTETLTVSYTPADANTGKGITWSSSDQSKAIVDNSGKVTGVAVGTATITATSEGGKTATCDVTVQAVAVMSVTLTPATANVQVNGTTSLTATVLPANATNKNVSWSSNNTAVATVSNGTVTGVTAGTAIITVTTVDGQKTATCSVTVTDAPPVPYTTLTLHEPEVYEANPKDGGYGANLTVFANREYEVYYGSYDESSNLSITVTPTRKIDGITTSKSSTSFEAKDGWFKGVASGGKSDYSFINNDEFKAGGGAIHKLANGNEYLFHIKGYDQFSIMGKDNNANASKNRHLEVYVDDNLQPMTLSTDVTIRRFDISTSEHVIKVKAIHDGDSKSELYAFSLRVAQVPFTKHLKGNDSTQVILQTTAMRPITYYTKYYSFGETILEWDGGQEATGISLQPRGQGAVGDTLVITGTANCPTGVYNFHINTYFNNTLTGSLPGKITVQSDIKALTETYAEGYQGMSIDDINFSYHALSADDITLSWKDNNAPSGISGSGANGIYSISGTPQSTGTFIYTVTVLGGNSITDTLVVKASDIPANAILYLYKNTKAYEKDGVYQYMTASRNLFPLKATSAGKRSQTEYNKFKWILISQDVDANNPEIIQLIQSRTGLPILNLNGFTYGKDEKRLGWGDPNNGAVDADKNRQGCSITIEQSGHPIFSKMSSPTDGKTVKIVDQYAKNGVMPIDVNNMPSDIASLCLATAHTRGVGYYEEGPLQTAIHEIPPVQGHSKYICLPLAREVTLTAEGKKLIDGIIDYLLSSASTTIKAPTLQMNSFAVAGHSATIDQANDLIVLSLTEKEYLDADSLAAVTPVITVDDPKTHVVPGADEVLDLRFANYITKTFVVTDYVNRRPYTLQLTITKPQGIDEVYTAGQWVNIFDIYGRKVTTTNEDVYTMELPHGMYIVVTENGGTIKIMR